MHIGHRLTRPPSQQSLLRLDDHEGEDERAKCGRADDPKSKLHPSHGDH
jgi:hypothetical protein